MSNNKTRLNVLHSESTINQEERIILWNEIGAAVRRIREEKHWSRETLAQKAHTSKDTIRRLELGLDINGYYLRSILETLGIILLAPATHNSCEKSNN